MDTQFKEPDYEMFADEAIEWAEVDYETFFTWLLSGQLNYRWLKNFVVVSHDDLYEFMLELDKKNDSE